MNACVCSKCDKPINANYHAATCNQCSALYHINCAGLEGGMEETDKVNWLCVSCLSFIYLFNHIDNDEEFLLALREVNSDFTFNRDCPLKI